MPQSRPRLAQVERLSGGSARRSAVRSLRSRRRPAPARSRPRPSWCWRSCSLAHRPGAQWDPPPNAASPPTRRCGPAHRRRHARRRAAGRCCRRCTPRPSRSSSTRPTRPILGRLHRTGAFVGTTRRPGRGIRPDHRPGQAIPRVNGTARDGREYSALDPHLLMWVHCTEADSFLRARQRYGATPLPGSRRHLCRRDRRDRRSTGVIDPPQNQAELRERLISCSPNCRPPAREPSDSCRAAASPAARPPYGILFGAATAMLPLRSPDALLPVAPVPSRWPSAASLLCCVVDLTRRPSGGRAARAAEAD